MRCINCDGTVKASVSQIFDTRFGIEESYGFGICEQCGLEQITPAPNSDELKRLYEAYYNFGGEINTGYTQIREKFLASPLYRWWLILDGDISFHQAQGSGNLLDIGCNEGRGLRRYKENGFTAEGLELNEKAAAVAQRQGFSVYTKLLEFFEPATNYDVAVLSNVLEHSLNPREMLLHVHRILKPGGQVWISCPNSRSWLRSIFGRFWINWHVPFHIVQFSPTTLRRLLEDAGFNNIQIKHETPALWVAHSLVSRLYAKPGQPTKKLRSAPLIAFLILAIRGIFFPILWLGNRLGRGDCLVVRAVRAGP